MGLVWLRRWGVGVVTGVLLGTAVGAWAATSFFKSPGPEHVSSGSSVVASSWTRIS